MAKVGILMTLPNDLERVRCIVALKWDEPKRAAIEEALQRHPIESGRCAALARVVFEHSIDDDRETHGIQVTPKSPAPFILPKLPAPPRWYSHTLTNTRAHSVDALTGIDGCPVESYLEQHWQYPSHLETRRVDLRMIDPGIEDDL